MLREYNVVIADTSCFILLEKINEWAILQKIFDNIITTEEVAKEFNKPLPSWIKIESTLNKRYVQLLQVEVDLGEASAIALAMEKETALLILDDWKARKLALKLNLNYTGTLGVFLKAKELGLIKKITPLIEKIQKTNFRFSEKVKMDILKEAGEG